MLNRDNAHRVRDALDALIDASGSAGAWQALPALSRLDTGRLRIDFDLRATEIVGVPVIIARDAVRPDPFDGRLTKRQREVALCLMRGLSNKQIARELRITLATTKDHVHAVLGRLGIDSRNQVAAFVFSDRT